MTTKTELLKIIHKQCLTCCGGSWLEVKECTGGKKTNEFDTCWLHPFRFGTDPEKPSKARQEAGRKLAEKKKLKVVSKTISSI